MGRDVEESSVGLARGAVLSNGGVAGRGAGRGGRSFLLRVRRQHWWKWIRRMSRESLVGS